MITESMKKYADTPIWDSNCNKHFWDMYLKDLDLSHTRYSSISEIAHLDFFPKTYIEVAEFDCLHDEGIAFAKTLISEGVETEYYSVHGTCHGFEAATRSLILDECMKRRVAWMESVYKIND